jgi:hypothetical protein
VKAPRLSLLRMLTSFSSTTLAAIRVARSRAGRLQLLFRPLTEAGRPDDGSGARRHLRALLARSMSTKPCAKASLSPCAIAASDVDQCSGLIEEAKPASGIPRVIVNFIEPSSSPSPFIRAGGSVFLKTRLLNSAVAALPPDSP